MSKNIKVQKVSDLQVKTIVFGAFNIINIKVNGGVPWQN